VRSPCLINQGCLSTPSAHPGRHLVFIPSETREVCPAVTPCTHALGQRPRPLSVFPPETSWGSRGPKNPNYSYMSKCLLHPKTNDNRRTKAPCTVPFKRLMSLYKDTRVCTTKALPFGNSQLSEDRIPPICPAILAQILKSQGALCPVLAFSRPDERHCALPYNGRCLWVTGRGPRPPARPKPPGLSVIVAPSTRPPHVSQSPSATSDTIRFVTLRPR